MITLRENERILCTVRRHRSILAGAFGLPVLVFLLVAVLRASFQFSFFGYLWQAVAALAVLSALYVGAKVLIWRRNALIVTDQRIVRYAQEGLLNVRVREVPIEDIADVVVRKHGLAALFGDKGTVVLTTTARQKVAMDDIAAPDALVELIHKLRRIKGAARADAAA